MTTVIYWMPDGKPMFYNRRKNNWFSIVHYLEFKQDYLAPREVSVKTIERVKLSMGRTAKGILTIGGIS